MIKRITVVDIQGNVIGHDWYLFGIPVIVNLCRKIHVSPISK